MKEFLTHAQAQFYLTKKQKTKQNKQTKQKKKSSKTPQILPVCSISGKIFI